jgi:VanZ family protein
LIPSTPRRLKVCACLLTVNLLFIWGNSLLPASISGAISGWIRELLFSLLTGEGGQTQGDGPLRRLAHFLEFCSLGALLCWLFAMLQKKPWAFLLPTLGCGCLVACIDETLQYFVPGRSPQLTDIGLDLLGLTLAIAFFSLGYVIKKRTQ